MGRVFLRIDVDLPALEDELVESITDKLAANGIENANLESIVKEAVHQVLDQEMIEDDKCGKILFCHKVSSDVISDCSD